MSTENMSNKVKMRGFMCHSPASTAVVCIPDDMRSVIVPGKSNRRSMLVNQHAGNIGRNVKYTRLVDTPNRSSKGKNGREKLVSLGGKNSVKYDEKHQQRVVFQQQQKLRDLELNNSSASSASTDVFQVVVLKVSLHCQGCAGKVKKHLSRMQGVTSFSIDLETKRVTVMGNISPSNVLESISKIKRAEFWTC